jgi:hypothetical protein
MTCVRWHARRLRALAVIDGDERRALVAVARRSDCARDRGRPGDLDGDGVLDDGDESRLAGDLPCSGGVIAGCDDNCRHAWNPRQRDLDGDGRGDACDPDADGDGVANDEDRCPQHPDATNADGDDDGAGDACDRCPDTRPALDVDRRGCADEQVPAGG